MDDLQVEVCICGISAELLKYASEPIAHRLHTIPATIWQSGTIPPDLLRIIDIFSCNGKGECWNFNSREGITL